MTQGANFDPASGGPLDPKGLALICEVVESCSGLSRKELAQTVCELVGWKRASGRLKALECVQLLERLESAGVLGLPAKERRRPLESRTRVPVTPRGDRGLDLVGEVGEFEPIEVEAVETPEQRLLFRELVGRHHYLGYAVPFGAQVRYLVYASRPARAVVGCVQFSSPAWRLAVRDGWIGWGDATRQRNLQRVVSNRRFLILPWVRIRNLASRVLSRA
ncbi:MAG: Druantia anti-phage system protein DruA, partial [Gemmatimonadales bacterium]